jgi:hypothetical protein
MDITAIILTHGQLETTLDTIDSVLTYMTDKVLLVVDEVNWGMYATVECQASILKGFYHAYHRAPYRNVALGILNAVRQYPDSDWYCCLEYDCLIGSSSFKKDLQILDVNNVWCVGNDYRDKQTVEFPLIELMLNTKFKEIVYLLGACIFYHKNFIKKAMQENFFERFLYYTNDFKNGFFPNYEGKAAWDLTEHMMPTLAKHWGGDVRQFAKWSQNSGVWVQGNYRKYPIRWQPQLRFVEEEYLQASIMHPIKDFANPIREFHRKKREKRKYDRQIIESRDIGNAEPS